MSQQTVLGVSLKGTLSSTWLLTAVMGVVVFPDGVHLMWTYEKNEGGGVGGALLTSVMISKLSHFLLLLLLLSCVPSPPLPALPTTHESLPKTDTTVWDGAQTRKHEPPLPNPSLIVPRFCQGGRRNSITPRDDRCVLRSDAKCAAKTPGRVRRGQNGDTTTIHTPLICHTHKQALSVLHHIKTTRPHLDSRSRFISGSISFPLPVLKHSSTAPPSPPPPPPYTKAITNPLSSARLYPRSPVGAMDSFCSIYTLTPSPVLPPQVSPSKGKQGAFVSLAV